VGLETTAALIIATFDLSVVRSIRGAMRTADISAGRGQAASPLGPAPDPSPRRHIHPEPTYERRPVIRATPRHEVRTVGYTVQYEASREAKYDPSGPPVAYAETCRPCCPVEGPIPPVWKQLPPVPQRIPSAPRRIIKVIRQQPDIRHKGIVVDIHI
jgi:hypothetical protein